MSEKSPKQHHESINNSELNHSTAEKKAAQLSKERAQSASHEHRKNIDTIRKSIENEARSKHEDEAEKPRADKENEPAYVSKDLVEESYRRTLNRTRQKLSPPMRSLSKIVHNPAVDAVSEVAGKTIARPSGVLAGGIAAFIGSSSLLWISKHYGYEYNFLVFALLFAGGFFVGLTVELFIRLILVKRRRNS